MDNDQAILDNIHSLIHNFNDYAKTNFFSFKRNYSNYLQFKLHFSTQKLLFTFIRHVDTFWLKSSITQQTKRKINIFFANNDTIIEAIKILIRNHQSFKVSYQKFILNQKILAIQVKNVSLFYPLDEFNLGYPILFKNNYDFYIINYCENDVTKEYVLRLIKEIYINYFEINEWVNFHGNSILLPNNSAAIILGSPGSGKTTLSAGLCSEGHSSYISDDRVMIQKRKCVAIPSTIYLDIRAVKKFKLEKTLIAHKIKMKYPRAKIPISFFKNVHTEKSFDAHNDGFFKISLLIAPSFDPSIRSEIYYRTLSQQESHDLLINQCLSRNESWKDLYLFTRHRNFKLFKEACDSQIKFLVMNFELLQITFGPDIDYHNLEKKLMSFIYNERVTIVS